MSSVDSEEVKQKQSPSTGQLRIFLGMSAGVGKTFAMLEAAHRTQQEGRKVLIGIVETHGRSETMALVEGLPLLPMKEIIYRERAMQEMDLEEILRQRPQLILVDELAHSNVPGSRHAKRYQDVLEILAAGIDVYTSLNVQHLESRKDSVEAITGVPIRETVPDSILEQASLVELVDIAPVELLKRLREGKVYLGDKAMRATDNFFKEDRLTALREIALRITAERVDQDLQTLHRRRQAMQRKELGNAPAWQSPGLAPWQTNERILVAFSHSPFSEKLIRAARRLAYNLEAPWIALYVDTGQVLSGPDQLQLTKNLNLAQELKAETLTTTETDVGSAIRRICRSKNVTQILVGRPTRNRLRDFFTGGSLLDRLVRDNAEVDVHVVRQQSSAASSFSLHGLFTSVNEKPGLAKYWFTFCFMFVITMISGFAETFVGYRAVGFLYLLAVLTVGLFGSVGAVMFAAALSSFAWIYFFIPPRLTFIIYSADDFILCITFFFAALITGFLANRLRFHERIVREREERTQFLYEVLRDIANSQDKSDFLNTVAQRVSHFLQAECSFILKSPTGKLQFDDKATREQTGATRLNEKDRAVAEWSFENQKPAGWSTDTLAEARALYLPLKGQSESVGVFIFQPQKKSRKLGLEQESLLRSIVQQLGLSTERLFLAKRLLQAQRLKDSEELHQTLLNSISHEMRTPLTAILGMAASLEDEQTAANSTYVRGVAGNLLLAGDRLNRVIENLLDMSRLNSGVLSLKLEWHDLNDLLGVVVQKNSKNLANHRVQVVHLGLGDEVFLVPMDFRLLEHAISNILLNATLYTPPGGLIQFVIQKTQDRAILEILDEGPGIPEDAISRIFEKFFRVPGSPAGGTGLGLSIVKSIIELHQGRVTYENRQPQGACFRIELPLGNAPDLPRAEKEEL